MSKPKNLLLKCIILIVAATLTFNVNAQQSVTLSGKVTDSSTSNEIGGVAVTVKSNSKKGTVTDVNGNFKITVPQGSVLVFSSVNYKTLEVPTGNDMFLNVTLAPASSELNEVVVIGYGTRKKKISPVPCQQCHQKRLKRALR